MMRSETPERHCRRCDEWWPDDAEFWRIARLSVKGQPIKVCLACHREWNRRGHERRMATDPEKERSRRREAGRRAREKARAA